MARSRFGFLILLLCLVFQPGRAEDGPGLPTGICSGAYYQCDQEARRVWSLFSNAEGVNHTGENFLAVGQCSVNGSTSGDVYVLLGLSRRSESVYFDAIISFYNDLSRYRNLPASAVPLVFPGIYRKQNLITQSVSYDYIAYTENTSTRYWIRYHPPTKSVVMVSYFGFKYTFLCEFPVSETLAASELPTLSLN
ncbi:MAG: hypothetical protein QNI91_06510 [Arenicellales bacterium]|nr:hypothetical protein [Arenicellales bacterium]